MNRCRAVPAEASLGGRPVRVFREPLFKCFESGNLLPIAARRRWHPVDAGSRPARWQDIHPPGASSGIRPGYVYWIIEVDYPTSVDSSRLSWQHG